MYDFYVSCPYTGGILFHAARTLWALDLVTKHGDDQRPLVDRFPAMLASLPVNTADGKERYDLYGRVGHSHVVGDIDHSCRTCSIAYTLLGAILALLQEATKAITPNGFTTGDILDTIAETAPVLTHGLMSDYLHIALDAVEADGNGEGNQPV